VKDVSQEFNQYTKHSMLQMVHTEDRYALSLMNLLLSALHAAIVP
jgi:hypothetical protein